jgi:hypothetical protein
VNELRTGAGDDPAGPQDLLEAAQAVLDRNWTGRCTLPSRGLYPHQWSWDAAFIAIGRAWDEQERAQRELESLFAAQWTNGMVPHIVFDPDVASDDYFPGPNFWQSDRAKWHPASHRTSGITQPPLHSRAALEVYKRARDRREALAFLERLYPKLAAQDDWLAANRDPDDRGLASIVHPWESGTDNSPLWDRDLEEMVIPPGALPEFNRRDLAHADPADRPTQSAYDRFVYLVITFRESGYDDHAMVNGPFLIEDPLFNSIWCWSAHALAEIAKLLGEDPTPHEKLADRVHAGMLKHLWDPEEERFHAYDLREHRQVRKQTVATLLPLLDPDLPSDVAGALIKKLESPHFLARDRRVDHFRVPSYDLRSPDFDRRRYWRGPVWANINWLLYQSLLEHGHPTVADDIADSTLRLAQRSGFREYFDPFIGTGYGGRDFSWTAALAIDLLRTGAVRGWYLPPAPSQPEP